MSFPFFETVQGTIQNIARSGLKSFIATRSKSAASDNHSAAAPSLPRSNASSRESDRAQMPSPSPKYLTRAVPDFLDDHENPPTASKPVAYRVEIDLESDDAEDISETKEKQTAAHITSASSVPKETLSRRARHSESRDEVRLMGGLVRRDPNATPIPDPMAANNKKFKASTIYQPFNSLTGKGAFLHQKTDGRRRPNPTTNPNPAYKPVTVKSSPGQEIRENNHSTPNKRRRTDGSQAAARASPSVISLDHSQEQDGSEDELSFSTTSIMRDPATKGCRTHDALRRPRTAASTPSAAKGSRAGTRNAESSDEGAFTKNAARQRKAEKDEMLASSSEDRDPLAGDTTSPFFRTTEPSGKLKGKLSKNSRHEAIPGSPDAIQGDETHPQQESRRISNSKLKARDFGKLIEGDTTSTMLTKQSRPSTKKQAKQTIEFELNDLLYAGLPSASTYIITVDTESKDFSLSTVGARLADEPLFPPRSIRQISFLNHGNGSSVVSMTFSQSGQVPDKLFLRFASEKIGYDFVMVLQKVVPILVVHPRTSDWMELAWNKFQNEISYPRKRIQASTVSGEDKLGTRVQELSPAESKSKQKRLRLVDDLDAPSPEKATTVISGAERGASLNTAGRVHPFKKQSPHESSPPMETAHIVHAHRRTLRSQIDQEKPIDIQPKPKASTTRDLGPAWNKDLVYPYPGRRAATVPFEDLKRLDSDEFLNDTLILFFMRYLETHIEKENPELYKRMYFFNTYFFEALTKTPTGKKGFNYDAVSRWTKNINLFSRDFVVVPVNENLHWYLAIICNLPAFVADDDGSGWTEMGSLADRQSEESPQDTDFPTAETQKSLADLSISDGEKKDQSPTKKKGGGRRKIVRRSLPKYDVTKPVIITLDSLGYARSSTCSHLRNYVMLEGKDKRNLDIDPAELRGMTAKEIPIQSNFSDCGLFVCAYLEQFIADPYNFIRRILQREATAQQWPRRIDSEDLRSRLRELILEMHRRQEGEPGKMEEPVIGSILIDKKATSLSPSASRRPSMTVEQINEAERRFDVLTHRQDDGSKVTHAHSNGTQDPAASIEEILDDRNTIPDSQDGHQGDEDDVIVYRKKSRAQAHQSRQPASDRGLSPRQNDLQAPDTHSTESPQGRKRASSGPGPNTHSNPAELAAQLREENNRQNPSKRVRLDQYDDAAKHRRRRSSSDLTDFLNGEQSYLLPGIGDYAARSPVSPERDHAAESRNEPISDKVRKRADSSPDPEVVGERRLRDFPTSYSKRGKRIPGGKKKAPQTERDIGPKINEVDHQFEEEVPETQQLQGEQAETVLGPELKRTRKDIADDNEMLLKR